MNFVEPIKSKETIRAMKRYFHERGMMKQKFLFQVGINTSLRISDILRLTWEDFTQNGLIRSSFSIKEQKTGKNKVVTINYALQTALKEYKPYSKSTHGYIFTTESRNGYGSPWTREYVWRMLKAASKEVGFKGNMGTHSLRKTFGYFAYKGGASLDVLMSLFNHSSPKITALYLGFTGEDVSKVYNAVNL